MADSARIWAREWLNKLRSNKFENSETTQCLVELNKVLNPPLCRESCLIYCNLFEEIIDQSDEQWITTSYSTTLLEKASSQLPPDVALTSFCSLLNQTTKKPKLETIISIMTSSFQSHIFQRLLLQESSSSSPPSEELWSKITTFVSSLPELISNKLLTTNDFFHHENYFVFLGVEISETISKLVGTLKNEEQVINTKFISLLIGQLCLVGKSDCLLKPLLPAMIFHTHTNFIWRRILSKIFTAVSDRGLQPLLLCLFQQTVMPSPLYTVLGDLIVRNSKAKFILLHKFLFLKFFASKTIPENIIGYVSYLPTSDYILKELLIKLLTVWSSGSAIKHTSYEQHKYITTSALICIRYLKNKELDQKFSNAATSSLMEGMRNHLESSDENMRGLGMVVGEKLTQILKLPAKDDSVLKFDYNNNYEALNLLELSEEISQPDPQFYQQQELFYNNIKSQVSSQSIKSSNSLSYTTDKQAFMEIAKVKNIPTVIEDKQVEDKQGVENDELDSDDDLIAMDLPKEELFTKVKKPMYIRECLAGLVENKDRECMEIHLNCLNGLISKDNVSAIEISVELCKILLNLQNNYSLDSFDFIVKEAITSLLTMNPQQVSTYIIGEFYSEHYNVQQRVTMLDVLVMAAGRISGVSNQLGVGNTEEIQEENENVESSSKELHWKEVLEKRIETKTRRFGKARKSVPLSSPDRFGPVAGCFFFPLMTNYDKRIRTLDLMGDDSIVLGRMLYALGTILYPSANSLVSDKMSLSLLQFLIPVRNHFEPTIRRACVFCVTMVTMTSRSLTTTLCDVILEAREWLCDVIDKDNDTRTRETASTAVALLASKIRKEMNL